MIKKLERWGRWLLASLVSLLFGRRRREISLPGAPAILVVRLDERIGNLLLLVPLLDSLRQRFPDARIDLLASVKALELLDHHPSVDTVLPFRKRALLAADGPLRTHFHLRRRRYDLAIDAANPTDPSTTQAILVRLCGARHTVGADHPGFGRSYSARVRIPNANAHEIDLRLALLAPVPGEAISRRVFLGELPPLAPDSPVGRFLKERSTFTVLNVGARLVEKMLPVDTYVALAERIDGPVVVTWGPKERAVAEAVAERSHNAALAPPTGLWELAHVLGAARAVLTCDTGPMHLSVAVDTPTCGIFVTTDPARYGYPDPPHAAIDARGEDAAGWLAAVSAWLARAA